MTLSGPTHFVAVVGVSTLSTSLKPPVLSDDRGSVLTPKGPHDMSTGLPRSDRRDEC